ncbi:hypothetical protein ACPUVO_12905 [Pseudocolwellia sp. HL-MZ19]|uniref:hypothetical protein n=1 Tax=Pseudocolwellia sp. HL-MZ19 TaxID=3400846 RepID=UPI003CF9514E
MSLMGTSAGLTLSFVSQALAISMIAGLLGAIFFAFFWSIASARLSAVISDVDHSGKYISAAQTVLGFAYILGPVLAATLLQDTGYTRIIIMGTVLFSLCFIFLLPLARFKTS